MPRIRRPSPALLVALLALLVASGVPAQAQRALIGTSDVRDESLRSRDIRNGNLLGKDIRDKSLTPADFRGSVRGPAGPAGAPGTARAFAHVLADGSLESVASKGIGRVARAAEGYYCFYLDFKPANVVATLDAQRSPAIETVKVTTRPDDTAGDRCTGAESASISVVDTTRGGGRELADGGFYVAFN